MPPRLLGDITKAEKKEASITIIPTPKPPDLSPGLHLLAAAPGSGSC